MSLGTIATEGFLAGDLGCVGSYGYLCTLGEEPPVAPIGGGGGGGIGAVSGESYFNQTPPTYKAPNQVSYLAQARQEDEEMLILLRAIVEIIQ